jgi:pimeloyl-ACP methyl ester carboxylesterase
MRPLRRSTVAAGAVLALGLSAACTSAQDIGGGSPAGPTTPSPATGRPPGTSPSLSPPTSAAPSTSRPPSHDDLPAGFGDGPPGHGLERFYQQQVTWTPCGPSETCAAIWVPLDYADPDGQAITIKAKMRRPGDSTPVHGTLFINPGGPGASGIAYLDYVGLGADVTSEYNIVGFDPRGVGASTPVGCGSDRLLDAEFAADPTPDTPAEIASTVRLFRQLTDACVHDSGPLLAHVSTIEAARDLDILRALVKDPKLNYYGASYGTYLGVTYAALFPDKVGRMVLDGAVDPEASPHSLEIGQAAGFQTELTAYLTQCVASDNCPLGGTVAQAQQQLVDLLQQIDAHPLSTSSGRPLTEGLAVYGLVLPLYSRDTWAVETTAIEQALEGNGDTLLYISDQYTHRNPAGHYTDNSFAAQSAVNCLDHPEHESVADIVAGRAEFVAASPVFGPFAAWFPYACSHWPVKPTLPQPDFTAPGAGPILVVGTTRDPATPYQGAVKVAHELQSGVLLTRDGDGHTAYSSGNVCIRAAVDRYLSTGQPPTDGTTC